MDVIETYPKQWGSGFYTYEVVRTDCGYGSRRVGSLRMAFSGPYPTRKDAEKVAKAAAGRR